VEPPVLLLRLFRYAQQDTPPNPLQPVAPRNLPKCHCPMLFTRSPAPATSRCQVRDHTPFGKAPPSPPPPGVAPIYAPLNASQNASGNAYETHHMLSFVMKKPND